MDFSFARSNAVKEDRTAQRWRDYAAETEGWEAELALMLADECDFEKVFPPSV